MSDLAPFVLAFTRDQAVSDLLDEKTALRAEVTALRDEFAFVRDESNTIRVTDATGVHLYASGRFDAGTVDESPDLVTRIQRLPLENHPSRHAVSQAQVENMEIWVGTEHVMQPLGQWFMNPIGRPIEQDEEGRLHVRFTLLRESRSVPGVRVFPTCFLVSFEEALPLEVVRGLRSIGCFFSQQDNPPTFRFTGFALHLNTQEHLQPAIQSLK